ncbi:NUDIX hydrolase [Calidifontibacter terrae]
MSHDRPGVLRRATFRLYRNLPPALTQRVIHTFTPTYAVGAVALIEHDGKVLGLRQRHRTGYSLPGGLMDRGEHPADAVIREVAEETGIRIDPGDEVAVVFDPEVHHCDVIFRVICDVRPEVRPASEAMSFAWLDLASWPDPDYATSRILASYASRPDPRRVGRLLAD